MLIPLTNEDARRRALEAVQAAKPGWVVSISKPNRSTAQNSLYWAVLQAISEQIMPGGQTYHPDTWHTYFKTLLLPGRMKELPGGQMVELEPTTTGMTTGMMRTDAMPARLRRSRSGSSAQ